MKKQGFAKNEQILRFGKKEKNFGVKNMNLPKKKKKVNFRVKKQGFANNEQILRDKKRGGGRQILCGDGGWGGYEFAKE